MRNIIPEPIFVGFFPKLPCPVPNGFGNDKIKEICSVSECIARGPEGWIEKWKHNDLGFFDREEIMIKLLEKENTQYFFYAYKLYPIQFIYNEAYNYSIQNNIEQKIDDYYFLGYDIVSRSVCDYFECSPLSCNGLHEIYPVNQFCLVDNLENAYKYCLEVEKQKAEPGPYYLFEVYRKINRQQNQCTRSLRSG